MSRERRELRWPCRWSGAVWCVRRVRRVRRGAAFLVALLAMARSAPDARGDETVASAGSRADGSVRLKLGWVAPAGCPSGADVLEAVDRLLGDRAAAQAVPIEVSAAVSQEEGGGFRVRLETPGEGSARVRELRGPTCAAVTDAAALILALMIDPSAVASSPPEASKAAPSEAPGGSSGGSQGGTQGSSQSVLRGGSQVAPGSPVSVSLRAGAWVGGDIGSLPVIAAGFGLTGALYYGPQRFELGLSAWPSRRHLLADEGAAGGDLDLFAASAGTCRDLRVGPVHIAPCGSFELGRLHAEGFGVDEPGSGAAVWIALKAGGLLVWEPWERFGLTARIEAVFPLFRPEFVLEGEEEGLVHRASAVTGRAAAGVEVRF